MGKRPLILAVWTVQFHLALAQLAAGQACPEWSQPYPSPRAGQAVAFDSKRGVFVVFGGETGLFDINYQTWEWDGKSWTLGAIDGPQARTWHAMAYDFNRGVTVLFGGQSDWDTLGDTWEWDGRGWELRSRAGPSSRSDHAMAYDPVRHVTVL